MSAVFGRGIEAGIVARMVARVQVHRLEIRVARPL